MSFRRYSSFADSSRSRNEFRRSDINSNQFANKERFHGSRKRARSESEGNNSPNETRIVTLGPARGGGNRGSRSSRNFDLYDRNRAPEPSSKLPAFSTRGFARNSFRGGGVTQSTFKERSFDRPKSSQVTKRYREEAACRDRVDKSENSSRGDDFQKPGLLGEYHDYRQSVLSSFHHDKQIQGSMDISLQEFSNLSGEQVAMLPRELQALSRFGQKGSHLSPLDEVLSDRDNPSPLYGRPSAQRCSPVWDSSSGGHYFHDGNQPSIMMSSQADHSHRVLPTATSTFAETSLASFECHGSSAIAVRGNHTSSDPSGRSSGYQSHDFGHDMGRDEDDDDDDDVFAKPRCADRSGLETPAQLLPYGANNPNVTGKRRLPSRDWLKRLSIEASRSSQSQEADGFSSRSRSVGDEFQNVEARPCLDRVIEMKSVGERGCQSRIDEMREMERAFSATIAEQSHTALVPELDTQPSTSSSTSVVTRRHNVTEHSPSNLAPMSEVGVKDPCMSFSIDTLSTGDPPFSVYPARPPRSDRSTISTAVTQIGVSSASVPSKDVASTSISFSVPAKGGASSSTPKVNVASPSRTQSESLKASLEGFDLGIANICNTSLPLKDHEVEPSFPSDNIDARVSLEGLEPKDVIGIDKLTVEGYGCLPGVFSDKSYGCTPGDFETEMIKTFSFGEGLALEDAANQQATELFHEAFQDPFTSTSPSSSPNPDDAPAQSSKQSTIPECNGRPTTVHPNSDAPSHYRQPLASPECNGSPTTLHPEDDAPAQYRKQPANPECNSMPVTVQEGSNFADGERRVSLDGDFLASQDEDSSKSKGDHPAPENGSRPATREVEAVDGTLQSGRSCYESVEEYLADRMEHEDMRERDKKRANHILSFIPNSSSRRAESPESPEYSESDSGESSSYDEGENYYQGYDNRDYCNRYGDDDYGYDDDDDDDYYDDDVEILDEDEYDEQVLGPEDSDGMEVEDGNVTEVLSGDSEEDIPRERFDEAIGEVSIRTQVVADVERLVDEMIVRVGTSAEVKEEVEPRRISARPKALSSEELEDEILVFLNDIINNVEPSLQLDSKRSDEYEDLYPAVVAGNPDEVLIIDKALEVSVTRCSLQTLIEEVPQKILTPKSHVNDEIINSYMSLIRDRSVRSPPLPKVFTFSTFFFESLRNGGYDRVKRWTRGKDIFQYDMILVPLNFKTEHHWALFLIDLSAKVFVFYDSLWNRDLLRFKQSKLNKQVKIVQLFQDYLVKEAANKKSSYDLNLKGFNVDFCSKYPEQRNLIDCGVFCMRFAEAYTRRGCIGFCQADMLHYRKQICLELFNLEIPVFPS